jgi:hypothetical protein
MLLKGTSSGPARARTVNTKKHGAKQVFELQVLDEDGGIVNVQTWRGTNLWPDAKVGSPVNIKIGRVSTYLGQTRATVAGEEPGD